VVEEQPAPPPQQQAPPPQQQAPPPQQYAPPPPPQQAAPPPPQQQYAAPPPPPPQQSYNQPGAPQPYGQPAYAATKRNNKLIIIIIAIAAAAAVIIGILAYNLGNAPAKTGGDDEEIILVQGMSDDPPPGRDPPPFEVMEAGFYSDDPNIKMIEINQGLSYGFDSDTGEFYMLENFVAGKETGIFVDLEKPVDPSSEVTLSIEKNGEILATLVPAQMVDDNTILFQPVDMGEVGYWEEGAYVLTFDMDGSKAVRVANFFKSMPIKVLAVPILANYSGKIIPVEGDWMNCQQMLVDTYPVAKADVEFVLGPELDLTNQRFDANTRAGRYNTWKALRDLQTPNNDYTLILGFIRHPVVDVIRGSGILGFTYGMPANIICESEPDMLATVVHEIAHCYYIGDEYEGGGLNNELNPPPYGMEGYNIVTREPDVGIKDKVKGGAAFGLMGEGAYVYPQQRAYRTNDRTLLDNLTSFMGSGTGEESYNFWITSDIWNHLFNSFTGQSSWGVKGGGDAPYDGQCPNCYGDMYDSLLYVPCHTCGEYGWLNENPHRCEKCGAATPLDEIYMYEVYIDCPCCWKLIPYPAFEEFNGGGAANKTTRESAERIDRVGSQEYDVIYVTGYFDPDGVFIADPWYTYSSDDATFVTAQKSGEYSLTMYDKNDEVLYLTYFDANVTAQVNTDEGQVFVEDEVIPVEIIAKFPEGTAKIVIKKEEEEIYYRTVSENAPEVAFTGMPDPITISGQTTITWEASDADGDDLYFQLRYYRSEEDYYIIASDITETSYDIDLSDYPGTNNGYFMLLASDGIHVGYNEESPTVIVPFKEPIFTSEQTEVPQYRLTEEIYFVADVYDKQDGWLDSDSIYWMLNGEMYCSGDLIWIWPYELEPGVITFTCVAENSEGVSASQDYKFEVLDDESDLPDDWSRDSIKKALKNGFIASLAMLDSPITRYELSRMLFALWASTTETTELDYAAFDAEINDLGPNQVEPYWIVYLGLMDAPDGVFDPAGGVSEQEAMTAIYKVLSMMWNPGSTEEDLAISDDDMLAGFLEMNVVSQDGENAYQADEKITTKLTLARLGLVLEYLYPEE